jgi:transcriptional regulator with XRE-family HTH domain/mannose-6-phosphate isomerase-like protein (cupin superfamily)
LESSNSAANGGSQLTQLGPKVREARQGAGLTLKDLASKVGLTPSHISQIERGVTNPSVSALLGISGALYLHMDYFFSSAPPLDHVVPSFSGALAELDLSGAHAELNRSRVADGNGLPGAIRVVTDSSEGNRWPAEISPVVLPEDRQIIKIVGGIEWHRLTPTNEDALEFLELHYPIGASSGPLAYSHRGREYNRVLQGTLLVELGFSKYTLTPGSAITFDCTIPHRFVNVGDVPFVGICLILDRF